MQTRPASSSRAVALIFGILMVITLPISASAQTTVTTGPPNPLGGGFGAGPLGSSNYFAGQTFTLPVVDKYLTSFSFWMAQGNGYPFHAWLAQWTGATTTGPVVDLGAVTSITNAGLSYPWQNSQRYDWVTGVSLVPGTYLIFVGFASGGGFDGVWRQQADTYAGGTAVAIGKPSGQIPVNGDAWGVSGSSEDLAFEAHFEPLPSTVPEPSTLFLMASGLLGVGLVHRKRRITG